MMMVTMDVVAADPLLIIVTTKMTQPHRIFIATRCPRQSRKVDYSAEGLQSRAGPQIQVAH